MLPKTFKSGSYDIPAVGLGTFQGDDGNSHVKDAVVKALRNGYRHVDTAAAYGNEAEVEMASERVACREMRSSSPQSCTSP